MTVEQVTATVAACGAVAQVAVACAAVYLASKANSINRKAFVSQRLSSDLYGALGSAREARKRYRATLRRFPTLQGKRKARATWLEVNEELSSLLANLARIDDRIEKAAEAWRIVESQDAIAREDKLSATEAEKADAMRRYDEAHVKFAEVVTDLVRRISDG